MSVFFCCNETARRVLATGRTIRILETHKQYQTEVTLLKGKKYMETKLKGAAANRHLYYCQ